MNECDDKSSVDANCNQNKIPSNVLLYIYERVFDISNLNETFIQDESVNIYLNKE